MSRTIRAPRGPERSCKGWVQEAALRMIHHNLEPDVAERPEDLVVYGGTGKAARSWEAFDAIVAALRELEDDETLLVQSGKPVGVMKSHADAPRVLIANSNLVGKWATWEHFRELERQGLMMYGQMTAGSWIYIGTQGILQGTYETFVAAGRQHFGSDDLAGRLILSAGLGGMGGAQPLAATMAGGVFLGVEVDPHRIERRLETGYLDARSDDLDEALQLCAEAKAEGRALSVGLLGNAAELLPEMVKRGLVPDLVTDQTSAHDELQGYVPAGLSLAAATELRKRDPDDYIRRSIESMATHVQAMLDFKAAGSHVFDYGNNIRAQAVKGGVANAFDFPGFVPAYIRPLFCEGQGPFRWVALSGDPEDIYRTDAAIKELFPKKAALHRWLDLAREKVHFQGLPSRICWLGYGERDRAGLRFNQMVADGEVSAPIVIGRDHLDCGSVASPNRETEGMKDGTDAVADWPILNALINAVNGASWVSFHHGGGVGIGYSLHAGQVIVADGTEAAARRLERVLRSDPGMGVIRHADAGYEEAIEVARERGVKIPGMDLGYLMSDLHGPGPGLLVENIGQLVTCAGDRSAGAEAALGLFEDAVVHCCEGKIEYAGPRDGLPAEVRRKELHRLDASGGLVTPGFVDPHTHLAFAGDRAAEFAERCAGVPYLEILKRGGGILSTVTATRGTEEDQLAELAEHRLRRLLEQGVTCVEVKSGYGLTTEEELKLLRAIATASHSLPGKVVSTLLGAHALPPEFEGRREAYVDLVCQEMIPAAAGEGLAAHVDAFVEEGAFTPVDARRIAKAAADADLGLRLHVDQLTAGGGAELAADLGAQSADHLEQISPAGVQALADSGCAAGLLPTATLYARLTTWAPGRALCDAGAILSIGTNLNPGTAMSDNHALALGLACLWNGLTPAEALLAATDGAARSLGLAGEVGRLSTGARADLVVHHATDYRHLAYHLGVNHVQLVVAGGQPVETTHTPG